MKTILGQHAPLHALHRQRSFIEATRHACEPLLVCCNDAKEIEIDGASEITYLEQLTGVADANGHSIAQTRSFVVWIVAIYAQVAGHGGGYGAMVKAVAVAAVSPGVRRSDRAQGFQCIYP